jgi:hypothetical protein
MWKVNRGTGIERGLVAGFGCGHGGDAAQHQGEGRGHQHYGGNRNQQPRQECLTGKATHACGDLKRRQMQQRPRRQIRLRGDQPPA